MKYLKLCILFGLLGGQDILGSCHNKCSIYGSMRKIICCSRKQQDSNPELPLVRRDYNNLHPHRNQGVANDRVYYCGVGMACGAIFTLLAIHAWNVMSWDE